MSGNQGPATGTAERQDFGGHQIARTGETTWSDVMDARRGETKPPPTAAETNSRGAMVGRIATEKIKNPERHDEAMAACGVASGMSPAQLPDETLVKIVAWLDTPRGDAEQGEGKPGADDLPEGL